MGGVGVPGYNISQKYKCFWVAPSRTGSRTVAQILTHYDFKFNGEPVFYYDSYNYSHITTNVNQYPHYEFICNARNPYARVYSHFQNYSNKFEFKTKSNFRKYVEMKMWKENNLHYPVLSKKPDYVLRLEHLKEDLMRVPFILDKLTERQLDLYLEHGKTLEPWEPHYDSDIKEIVYEEFKDHFYFFNYEK